MCVLTKWRSIMEASENSIINLCLKLSFHKCCRSVSFWSGSWDPFVEKRIRILIVIRPKIEKIPTFFFFLPKYCLIYIYDPNPSHWNGSESGSLKWIGSKRIRIRNTAFYLGWNTFFTLNLLRVFEDSSYRKQHLFYSIYIKYYSYKVKSKINERDFTKKSISWRLEPPTPA